MTTIKNANNQLSQKSFVWYLYLIAGGYEGYPNGLQKLEYYYENNINSNPYQSITLWNLGTTAEILSKFQIPGSCYKIWVIYIFYPAWTSTGTENDAKDDTIAGAINQLLTRDYFKVSTFGVFSKNANDIQIVINDIHGVTILSSDGTILKSFPNFCNNLFARTISNIDGCDSGSRDCGNAWDCGELEFDAPAGIKRRVSFNFYDNHDLSKGGLRIGDFDGDGIDDLWCHQPGTTLGYTPDTANQIIFSPLLNRGNSFGDQCRYITDLMYPGWCASGVVYIGDFNGDLSDDALCVTDTVFYILYGIDGTFLTYSHNADGWTSMLNMNEGWTSNSKILVGNFNGDSFADLILLDYPGGVLYGTGLIGLGPFITGDFAEIFPFIEWSADSVYNQCLSVDINRIFAIDVNQDNLDDIVCIVNQNVVVNIAGGNQGFYTQPIARSIYPLPSSSRHQFFAQQETAGASSSSLGNTKIDNIVSAKLTLILNDITLQQSSGHENHQQKVTITQNLNINSRIDGNDYIIGSLKTNNEQKIISGINLPLDSLNLNNYEVEVFFSLAEWHSVAATALWSTVLQDTSFSVFLKGNGYWRLENGVVVQQNIESAVSDMPEIKFFIPGFNCINASLITTYAPLEIQFTANVKIYAENNNGAIVGNNLENLVSQISNGPGSFTSASNDFVTVSIAGSIEANLLGISYTDMTHCN